MVIFLGTLSLAEFRNDINAILMRRMLSFTFVHITFCLIVSSKRSSTHIFSAVMIAWHCLSHWDVVLMQQWNHHLWCSKTKHVFTSFVALRTVSFKRLIHQVPSYGSAQLCFANGLASYILANFFHQVGPKFSILMVAVHRNILQNTMLLSAGRKANCAFLQPTQQVSCSPWARLLFKLQN